MSRDEKKETQIINWVPNDLIKIYLTKKCIKKIIEKICDKFSTPWLKKSLKFDID
jgi:hypothetical protein